MILTNEDNMELIEQYKKICRIAGVPEYIIEHPYFIDSDTITEADMEWVKKRLKNDTNN